MIGKHLPELRRKLARFRNAEAAVKLAYGRWLGANPTDQEYCERDDAGVDAARAAQALEQEISNGTLALVNGAALRALLECLPDVGSDTRALITALVEEPQSVESGTTCPGEEG